MTLSLLIYDIIFICGLEKIALFWFCEALAFVSGNVCNAGRQKEILKNAKGGLSLSFLSPVPFAKHGQLESLSAWPIWSVCRVRF
jgi:hypothetical protein